MCLSFIEKINDKDQLIGFLDDTDLDERPVSNLIKQYPELLQKIETVIEDQWKGEFIAR